ncbi:alternate-type signal peptide domain-containing protein [Brevibacterium luteolum]|uniref:alternate-type signal peptide domain-containing protein n=1 Tax=Brevibacterium luteolum TaxID=199591 RepID=UPI00223C3439|nr:alternate-type signal peptide domain-containing protein [Brevibacterium luteolum]MCT1872268.1 alternate-type signal peptide domain-containing protein [Brevibacterium luteolum]MCT1889523.1 alternate-type signal peptide domain-containing protein [Brevibacterium luteolum]MCT1892081.1 alternate-type signal peptide domain-containing protein [Brevibacterium luteolum]MCT1922846.1 alternate-type signal peptide domain-containing protein [Brevibacterium luteolum]
MTETPTQKKPNRRAAKAAAAGALGVALLAGLGTTFAKWYEEASIGESSLQSGHLDMTVDGAQWTDLNSGQTIDEAQFKMVPGDKLRYTANITPDLVGDNLVATLKVNTDETVSGDLDGIVKVTTTVGEGNDTKRTVTPADNGKTIRVTVELEFPLTKDGQDPAPENDRSNWWVDRGEDGTVNLSSTKVELIQNNNS